MGVVDRIDADRYPRQSDYVGRPVRVCFRHDTSREFAGIVLRDDREDPWLMLILLSDGRVVRATECQWSAFGGVIAHDLRAFLELAPVYEWIRARAR